MPGGPAAPQLQQAARTLLVDLVTAETSAALSARGIPHVLLKGPALARWLYRDGTVRPYIDSDVLVPPRRLDEARELFRETGFRRYLDPKDAPGPTGPADAWIRKTDGAIVDLHWSLVGVGPDPAVVWAALSANTVTIEVAGQEMAALGLPARALHVALHAAQHGAQAQKSLEDLRRTLLVVSPPIWQEVTELAERLQALEPLGEGLRLLPEGRQIAQTLSLPGPSLEVAVRAVTPPPVALGLVHLSAARGPRARAAYLLRKAFPRPGFMATWSPLARRGKLGLLAAYVWRWFWITAHLPGAVRVWRDARRRVASGPPRA